ncbi:MAG TPA: helix-turn-helix transcriptional regulator [Rudaea sp.]
MVLAQPLVRARRPLVTDPFPRRRRSGSLAGAPSGAGEVSAVIQTDDTLLSTPDFDTGETVAWSGPPQRSAAPFRIEPTPFDRVLRKTRRVALGRYHCPPEHAGSAQIGEPFRSARVMFHRTGVKLTRDTGAPEVLTPNHVSFHRPGEVCAREATGADGHGCDWLALAPEFLHDLGVTAFAHTSAPVAPAVFLALHDLFVTVENQIATLPSARIEAAVAQIVVRVLAEAARFHARAPRRKPRPTCRRRREQIVEDAKALLARDCAADLSMLDLASRLHCSAAHLSRTFHAVTGSPFNAYRQDLRLRRGMVLLEQTDLEIGDIALQLGFSSHSHFTSAFHKRFGINPSTYQRQRCWGVRRHAV